MQREEELARQEGGAHCSRAAFVIDDLVSTNPWRPRASEVRGRAEAIHEPEPTIRIYPERIVSWGIEPRRNARTVARANDLRAADDPAIRTSAGGAHVEYRKVFVVGGTGAIGGAEDARSGDESRRNA